MRLVACSDCHTQYDVSDVAVERFACRCGSEIENRSLESVDARILRCGSCGASVDAAGEHCAYCGSAIERDPRRLSLICPECYARCADDARFCTACGVAFRPEQVRLEGHELPCPVCDRPMPPQRVGGVGVNECTRCTGLWVPGDSFDRLVARAIETRRQASPEQLLRLEPRVRGGNPASQQIRYRKCPVCMGYMQRRNFQKSSGVIVDVCHAHGTWLDADELEQIAGFLLSGGQTSSVLVAEERRAQAEFARIHAENLALQRTGRSGAHRHRNVAGTLLEVLDGLLD